MDQLIRSKVYTWVEAVIKVVRTGIHHDRHGTPGQLKHWNLFSSQWVPRKASKHECSLSALYLGRPQVAMAHNVLEEAERGDMRGLP